MNKAKKLLTQARDFGNRRKPELLTGFAVAGLWGTLWYTYHHAPKAKKILTDAKKSMHYVEEGDKDAKRAVVKDATIGLLPHLLPTLIGGGLTTVCIIGSNRVSSKRIATLSAAYALSETAFRELNTKLIEKEGVEKAKLIKDSIAKDHLKKRESEGGIPDQLIFSGDGNVLCLDSYSGKPFRSNYQKIESAIVRLSSDCARNMYVSLNELYQEINSPELLPVPMGQDFGWNVDDLDRNMLPITISAQITESGVPCLCLEYYVKPRHDYQHFM